MAKKKLFTKPTHYIVTAFVIGLISMLAYCEDASASWSAELWHDSNAGATEFNAGLDRLCVRKTFPTQASVMFCPLVGISGRLDKGSWELGLAERWGRWEAQINLNQYDSDMDGGFSVRRIVGDGPFNMAIGGTYWINESPGSSSNFTYNLGLRYTF